MWGYDIIIVCGMTMVGLIISAFIGMIILSSVVTPSQREIAIEQYNPELENDPFRLFPWPPR